MITYTWQDVGDENDKILTQEEKQIIADKWNASEQAKASIQWKKNRENEYPSIVDQLDDIYHNGIDGWKATIKVTKDKYPKE